MLGITQNKEKVAGGLSTTTATAKFNHLDFHTGRHAGESAREIHWIERLGLERHIPAIDTMRWFMEYLARRL